MCRFFCIKKLDTYAVFCIVFLLFLYFLLFNDAERPRIGGVAGGGLLCVLA